MGRTANKGVEPVELQPLDGETLLATQNLMASQSAEVMALYGDGLAYDRERVMRFPAMPEHRPDHPGGHFRNRPPHSRER